MKEENFILYRNDDTLTIKFDYIDTLKFLSIGINKLLNDYENGILIDTTPMYNDYKCLIDCNFSLEKICLLGVEEYLTN